MAVDTNIVKAFLEEPLDYVFEGLVLAFLWQTFSIELAGVYFILLAVDAFIWFSLKPKLNFNSVSGNSGQALITAFIAFAVFIALSVVTVKAVQAAAQLNFADLLARLGNATFGATVKPLLSSSPIAIFLIGAVIIPKRETKTLIARLMEFLSIVFKVPLELKSPQTWVLWAVVSAVGVIFHFQVKGVTDNIALALTFVFWMVSCWLIVKTRESESAVYLHMINNGWTLLRIFQKAT